ncbi:MULTISPECIES: hypothetical protein [unclassified Moorena]|uniref:hypothetical protein n=1 Tax=unclassified Moorena TaxID=2683338 RepID=UPI0025E88BBA|nr:MULTISPECIES: hypothetical protein [unclassified Moorena]
MTILIKLTFINTFMFPIPDSRFPIPDSRFPTPYSLLPTPYSLLPTPYSLLPSQPITDQNKRCPKQRFVKLGISN